MSPEVVTWLDKIGLGTFIVILIAVFSGCSAVFKLISVIYGKYKAAVDKKKAESVEEYKETQEDQEFRQKVEEMGSQIEKIETALLELTDMMKSEKEERQKRITELNTVIENDKAKSINDDKETQIQLRELSKTVENMSCQMSQMTSDIGNLVGSDCSRIKTFITEQWHTYMPLGEIDTLKMAAIEEQFAKYDTVWHANTFVASMMDGLRQLKKVSLVHTDSAELLHYINLYGGDINVHEEKEIK